MRSAISKMSRSRVLNLDWIADRNKFIEDIRCVESMVSPLLGSTSLDGVALNDGNQQTVDNVAAVASKLQNDKDDYILDNDPEVEWVGIGSGNTMIPKDKYEKIKWDSYAIATRSLLRITFTRQTLATHCLNGKKTPAFPFKKAKKCLNPRIIADVVKEVVKKCGVPENKVRSIITTKCADEAKIRKVRMSEKTVSKVNNENIPPSYI